MRGLRAVLYIAVLLCVAQFASADCGANGNLIEAAGHCVCLSGYSDAACGTAPAASCGSSMSIPSATQADHFPVLDLTSAAYTQNTLRVTLLGPYVQGRRYNSIIFVNQNATACSLGYHDSFWSTNFTAGCQDSFHIDMPWVNHADCGFTVNDHVENSTNDLQNEDNQTLISQNHYVSFSARFTLNYTDLLGTIEGFNLTRTTAVPYRVFVQFPTRLDVSLSNVQIKSEVEMGFALTGDNFDPETRTLTIEMTFINSWPNMLDPKGANWYVTPPTDINFNANLGSADDMGVISLYDRPTDCANDAVNKPLCKQVFQFEYNTDTLCTYDGTYNFTVGLYTCRDDQYTSCTSLLWDLSFTMETSSICSSINTTLELKGHIVPYHNIANPHQAVAGFSGDATSDGFTIGSYGYFQVVLDDMQGNTVDLDFYEISFQSNGFTNKNYLMRNHNVTNSDTLPANANNDSTDYFHYNEAKLEVNNDGKWFAVYFSSVVFKVLPSSVTTYTFRASAYATYLGNDHVTKKRSVEFVWDAPAVENQNVNIFAKVGLRSSNFAVAPANLEQGNSQVNSNNLAYIIGGGGAGLVLIVLAVIGLAIHHKKRQVAKALAEATRA